MDPADILAEEARDEAIKAARALVDKLVMIHDDERYKSVWTLYYVHGGRYNGPTYEHELKELRTILTLV